MQDKLLMLPSRPAAELGRVSDRVSVRFRSLPAQLTPLIGREHEVAAVCTLLRRPEVRLLTLTGTGGVGKTRLALHIATTLLDDFAQGVCFVSLAPISDPELVLPTIAQTLGLWEAGDRPLVEYLKAYLREKQVLLLLDNFEQVVQASPLLVELLHACPGLKVLVTSRAVLHVSGEHEFPVPPLALPDLKPLPASAFLSQYAAVALFLQRAQASKPDFQLTPVNAPTLAEMCARLDGLPLAIELAAARIKLLPPQALLKRLEHRLSILTGGACNLPLRQQTLRNTIQWSYDLLSAEEQRLFWRLSVFVGGFTLQAVEALYAALDDEGAESVSDGVNSLIDKSLLQSSVQVGDEEEPRLGMLETIREYALERLTASGELEATRKAHAAYYLALAEEAESHLAGPQQVVWLERLEREHDNLRAAMQWSLEPGAGNEGSQRIELALQLGSTLQCFWMIRGHLSEGQSFLERALASSEGVTAAVRARALTAAAKQTLGQALSLLARGTGVQEDYATACALYEESLAVAREIGDKMTIAVCLEGLADMAVAQRAGAASRTGVQPGELSSLWAAHLWGAAESLREAMGVPIPPVDRATYEHSVERARAQLGARAFAKAWAAGRTMSLEEVLAARAEAESAQQGVPTPSTATSSGHATPTNTQPVAPTPPPPRKAGSYPDELTAREMEVLRLVAQGFTDAQVAEQLVISPRTVNWHLTSIYSKLGISSRSAATRYAIEHKSV